jgi:L-threonylcarbamoyladenylate synthase
VTQSLPSPRAQALAVLREGGLVCVPTESSYGLAVDASRPEAIERLQELKGRGVAAPFGLIAGTYAQAKACTGPWPEQAEALAARHWPGPLTLILPPLATTAPQLVGPTGGVGLRVSSAEAVAWLATELGSAITATSANPTGKAPATTSSAAQGYFGDRVDFYLDGGPCEGRASTLVAFDAQGRPQVLRQGPIVLPTHS